MEHTPRDGLCPDRRLRREAATELVLNQHKDGASEIKRPLGAAGLVVPGPPEGAD